MTAFGPGLCEGGKEIYSVKPDGSGLAKLANMPEQSGGWAWSPDGRRIAFSSGPFGYNAIYTMNVDGSNIIRLTDDIGFLGEIAWSPDGSKIAFTRPVTLEPKDMELFVVNATQDSGENNPVEVIQLTQDIENPAGITWSPDSQKIAFFSSSEIHLNPYGLNIDYTPQVFLVNADGTGLSWLQEQFNESCCPSWSPGGHFIVLSNSNTQNTPALYRMDTSGRFIPFLADPLLNLKEPPAWSLEGRLVVVVSASSGGEIIGVKLDGSDAINLSNSPADDGVPAWSPDGTILAFASNRGGALYDIYLMQAVDPQFVRLTTSPPGSSSTGPAWIR